MEKWVIYALISMSFAGVTSVVAKLGLSGISAEVALAVRTAFVFFLIFMFASLTVSKQELATLTQNNIAWLGLSGVTTAISWVFYYRALKLGEVSTVALIDKGSFIVAVLLAWVVLKEPITLRVILGGSLIVIGLLIVSGK